MPIPRNSRPFAFRSFQGKDPTAEEVRRELELAVGFLQDAASSIQFSDIKGSINVKQAAGLTALILTTETTLVTANMALAARTSTLEASLVDRSTGLLTAHARISLEQQVRVTREAAFAYQLSSLTAQAGHGVASVIEERNARATADGVVTASLLVEVSARQDADSLLSASVTAESTARSTADGFLAANYSLTVTAGSVVTGMKINSSSAGGATSSTIDFTAANFRIWDGTSAAYPIFETSPGVVKLANTLTVNTSGKVFIGTGTFNSADTAFYVDSAGNLSLKNKLSWDGSTLSVDGAISATSTIGGRLGSTLASSINSAGNLITDLINARLDTAGKTILADFTFGVSGALAIGTYSAGVNGDVRLSQNGILGRNKDNVTTFAIDATTGEATFRGTLAASGVFTGTLSAATVASGGLYMTSGVGIRFADDISVLTITGGNGNGFASGAQIDLVGKSLGTINDGALVLAGGDSTSTDINAGAIHFRAGDALVGLWRKNQTFEIYSSVDIKGTLVTSGSGKIGGWSATATTFSSGDITLDAGNTRIQAGPSANTYVRISPSGIVGVDNVLGTTFNLPTDGSAPTFSSGIINSTVFNITSAGILETSATAGNGGASGQGVRINDTGIKGWAANNATPNFFLDATDGKITAIKGTIGGINLASSKIYTDVGTFNSADTGFYLSSSGQFSLKEKFSWDGTDLSVQGSKVYINMTPETTGGVTLNSQINGPLEYFGFGAGAGFGSANIFCRMSDGTQASKVASTAGTNFGLNGRAWDGSAWVDFGRLTFTMVNAVGTNLQSYFSIYTKDTSNTNRYLFMRDGNITIDNANTAGSGKLNLYASTGSPSGASQGIYWGTDVNLYRNGVDELKTDDNFSASVITANGVLYAKSDVYLGYTGNEKWLYDHNSERILRARYSGTPATLADVIAVLQHHGLSN